MYVYTAYAEISIIQIHKYIYIYIYRNIFSKRKSFISDHVLHTRLCAAVCSRVRARAKRSRVYTRIVERKRMKETIYAYVDIRAQKNYILRSMSGLNVVKMY